MSDLTFSGFDGHENQLDDRDRDLSSPGSQPGDRDRDRRSPGGCFVTVNVN
jgi:hypothetical protein